MLDHRTWRKGENGMRAWTWKRLGIGLLTTTILIGGGMASAQQGPTKETDPFQKLGLSADQRTKLDAAKNERMTSLSATQQKVIKIRQKLMGLVADKKAQDREIDKVADEWAAADKEALKTETKFYKAIRQILTQEQLTKLSQGNGK
jgi:Spy/CpxP family protein refolding chaperone